MTSAVSICNMALARVGVQHTISSMTERGPNAQACATFYDHSRIALLREIPWPFVERTVALALVETTPVNGWAFSYRYPANAVRMNHILSAIGQRNPNPPTPYKIGSDESGRLIFTDVEFAVASYNVNQDDPNQFDEAFVDAITWRIATELAPVLSRDPGFNQVAIQQYQWSLRKAAAVAFNEDGQEDRRCSLTDARN
jgi:hypothetical protein